LPVIDFLSVLDNLSNHGCKFVLETDIIDALDDESIYRNPNKRFGIRKFLKTNGLILSRGSPLEMMITFLGIDALNNEYYKSWFEHIKEFAVTLPPLSLLLMERQKSQNSIYGPRRRRIL
jgi:hypothetical protein